MVHVMVFKWRSVERVINILPDIKRSLNELRFKEQSVILTGLISQHRLDPRTNETGTISTLSQKCKVVHRLLYFFFFFFTFTLL